MTADEIIKRVASANPRARLFVHFDEANQHDHVQTTAWKDLKFNRLNEFIGQSVNLDALVAAILGMFHIDQLPSNLPSLTGANSQRILGRLTPGRPSNWRQLIRAMAQHHPAPMKLKDAI